MTDDVTRARTRRLMHEYDRSETNAVQPALTETMREQRERPHSAFTWAEHERNEIARVSDIERFEALGAAAFYQEIEDANRTPNEWRTSNDRAYQKSVPATSKSAHVTGNSGRELVERARRIDAPTRESLPDLAATDVGDPLGIHRARSDELER